MTNYYDPSNRVHYLSKRQVILLPCSDYSVLSYKYSILSKYQYVFTPAYSFVLTKSETFGDFSICRYTGGWRDWLTLRFGDVTFSIYMKISQVSWRNRDAFPCVFLQETCDKISYSMRVLYGCTKVKLY